MRFKVKPASANLRAFHRRTLLPAEILIDYCVIIDLLSILQSEVVDSGQEENKFPGVISLICRRCVLTRLVTRFPLDGELYMIYSTYRLLTEAYRMTRDAATVRGNTCI